jgi:transposase
MVDWMNYSEIQELKRRGLKKTQVARHLNLNRETVTVYWDMAPQEYATRLENTKERTKKASCYKDYVLECLRNYPDISAAQIFDWLKEKYLLRDLGFKERAFRYYVKELRIKFKIEKHKETRQYEAVDDLPFGQQAQVDMGEILLSTQSGKCKRIYCFAMVLSNSRYKFALWQEKKFTTESFVQAHVKALAFFGGRPQEIVYDQDNVLAVSENNGDIIYTEGFQNYINEVKFHVYLCRGSDPESKGKVENVVKYVKHGFAEHRIFTNIDEFNEKCIAWLNRTGNIKRNETTKKIPAEVFSLEKEYLLPVSEQNFAAATNKSISYQVRKDNIVLYKGNRYRVPKGTYAPGKRVSLVVDDEKLTIKDMLTSEIYAVHPLCHEKGRLIGHKRDERDKSKTLLELEAVLKEWFHKDDLIVAFMNHIHEEKPRYYRDQLGVIKSLFDRWNLESISAGLQYCMEKELYSAGELKSSIIYLEELKNVVPQHFTTPKLPVKYCGNAPEVRSLSIYEDAMDGGTIHG